MHTYTETLQEIIRAMRDASRGKNNEAARQIQDAVKHYETFAVILAMLEQQGQADRLMLEAIQMPAPTNQLAQVLVLMRFEPDPYTKVKENTEFVIATADLDFESDAG